MRTKSDPVVRRLPEVPFSNASQELHLRESKEATGDCVSFRHNIWRECWVDGLSPVLADYRAVGPASITSHDKETEATMTGKRKREDIEDIVCTKCLECA